VNDNKKEYRTEQKYLISFAEAALIRSRIEPLMCIDENAGTKQEYTVRSLYFDDYFDTAYRENKDGLQEKKKYRIRIYDQDDSFIRLERKSKVGQYGKKQSAVLTREEVQRILSEDYGFLERSDKQLLQEFYYELTARILRPRVMVEYDRIPYVYIDHDIRVTFDKNVRVCRSAELLDPDLTLREALTPGVCIMEVKYYKYFPDHLRHIVVPKAFEQSKLSKFVLGCELCPKIKGI